MTWEDVFKEIKQKDYYKKLEVFWDDEYQNHKICPSRDNIFNAFKLTPLENVKVVIFGMRKIAYFCNNEKLSIYEKPISQFTVAVCPLRSGQCATATKQRGLSGPSGPHHAHHRRRGAAGVFTQRQVRGRPLAGRCQPNLCPRGVQA